MSRTSEEPQDSEADRRRHDSIYEEEGMVPEQLLKDLADTRIVDESQIDRGVERGSHRGTLTPAERLVVLHLSHGLSTQMIAEIESKGRGTVRTQVKSAKSALNAKTAAHLVAIALRQGLID